MAITLGHDPKVLINGIRFAVTQVDGGCRTTLVPINDSETGTQEARAEGREQFYINSLTFQSDPTVPMHTAPINIRRGETVSIEILQDGEDTEGWACADFKVSNFNFRWDSSNSNPVTGTISGESNGDFQRPGDA